jgi:hypothetical protein
VRRRLARLFGRLARRLPAQLIEVKRLELPSALNEQPLALFLHCSVALLLRLPNLLVERVGLLDVRPAEAVHPLLLLRVPHLHPTSAALPDLPPVLLFALLPRHAHRPHPQPAGQRWGRAHAPP